MTRRTLAACFFVVLCSAWPGSPARADDALVLPKGVSRFAFEANDYFPIDERFGPDGKVENVAVDFNRPLNSRAFPLLAPLDPLVPGGLASIGDSVVSFKYDVTILKFSFAHGLTDRLTAGVQIPYWWVTNIVKARLNSAPGSSANVGLNPTPFGPPVIPLWLGGVRFTTEDVQKLLGPGLKGIPGFGYKRFETWSDDGLSDIEAGFKYQYLKTSDLLSAISLGARFPTGQTDDPDNLVDVDFGSGAYGVLFRLHADYLLSNLWKGRPPIPRGPVAPTPGDLVFNGTFRYDLVLPDTELKRVPSDPNNPITLNKEQVSRDLGDVVEFEVSGKYTLFPGFSLSGLYKYGFKFEDQISGKKGFAYQALEEETARTEHIYIAGISYSTLPLYLEKAFPVPLTLSLSYRSRFAGSNNVYKAQYLGIGLEIFF